MGAVLAVDNTFDSPYLQRPTEHGADLVVHSTTSNFGGMISVCLDGDAAAHRLLTRTRLFSLAESLGGIESLISLLELMTHASIPAEVRAARGVDATMAWPG